MLFTAVVLIARANSWRSWKPSGQQLNDPCFRRFLSWIIRSKQRGHLSMCSLYATCLSMRKDGEWSQYHSSISMLSRAMARLKQYRCLVLWARLSRSGSHLGYDIKGLRSASLELMLPLRSARKLPHRRSGPGMGRGNTDTHLSFWKT